MTTIPTLSDLDFQTLLNDVYRPVFAEFAQGAQPREDHRHLLFPEISRLRGLGFGALRLPKAEGGAGLSLPQLFDLLAELAAADANLPQALRNHFAFVEQHLNEAPGPNRDKWLTRIREGAIAGGAWTEPGAQALSTFETLLTPDGAGWRLNGRKFYATGSIYADWLEVACRQGQENVIARVRNDSPGLTHHDDWDGFGQQLTGSGTSVYKNVPVAAEDVIPFTGRFSYQPVFYQLILLSVLVGITAAVLRDAVALVKARPRAYPQGNAARGQDDVQIQQIIGEIAARATGAKAVFLAAAAKTQLAYEANISSADETTRNRLKLEAEIATYEAQIVIAEAAQLVSTRIFDALGSSATSVKLRLDRHWRNARTVISHNPLAFRSRMVGDWYLNGNAPDFTPKYLPQDQPSVTD
ncbi:monooxygenase [Xinfangfangia sp. D13-10-4-6]|uniref:acyl-CoA dehydrogenase family protein n=1 Tax=Pseudogemmobacter hezensis TaxID=2737662 RepID=UPI001556E097|nr:acyl-CoA dehydrogenase family protein [Pseudogemmobacter hezensis]NPD14863.1 monooxygenase [Pseudogemmobacter hezensis]